MDMITNVRNWLEKTGFSLELRTASAFRAAGFQVKQSGYYTDPETNKAREIDVEAVSSSVMGAVEVKFIVECKSNQNPWILLCSNEALANYHRADAFAAMSRESRAIFVDRFVDLMDKFSWLRKDRVIAGYALRQAFSEKDKDLAYSAAVNVAKASHSRVAKQQPPFRFIFPVIVVDTPLLRCGLNDRGEIELKEAEEGEFLFTGHELGTCIRVVTIAKLPSFALFAMGVAVQLQDELQEEEQDFLSSLAANREI
jgi:hypothetical protein